MPRRMPAGLLVARGGYGWALRVATSVSNEAAGLEPITRSVTERGTGSPPDGRVLIAFNDAPPRLEDSGERAERRSGSLPGPEATLMRSKVLGSDALSAVLESQRALCLCPCGQSALRSGAAAMSG